MAYAYDPLGRLKTTTSGSGTGAVATTDSWNIQGWLTSRTALKGSANIFSMSLGYYTPTLSGPAAKYSGDISSWTWTQSGQTARSYGFTYDGAHRLTAGQYYSGASATNALSEKAIAYDRNGNVTALTRYNSAGTATTLSYSYAGNRRSTFSYDANGNVSSDAANSLQSSYNLLNLPAQIKSGNTVKANYTYLSDGTKAAAYTSASAGKDYVGSFTYTRGSGGSKTLESVAFGGGRIRKSGSSYVVDYHITDHLGSVRAIVNASGVIQEQNDYYPFGQRHPNGLTTLSTNRWRFGGKEEQDGFGISYSDYGARLYDRTAAWTAMDPLAEKYYSVSPYAYCNDNPVKLADTDGQVVHIAVGAAIGATINGGIAAIQGKSPQEIKAAAAGGAVAGAITAATGGVTVVAAVGSGALAGAAGSLTEQFLGSGNIDIKVMAEDLLSGAIGGFIGGKGGGAVLKRIEGKVASQIEKKYASESVITAIQEEVKKEYKAAGKVFGPATKKSMKKAVSDRIETLAGTQKAINSMVNKVAKDTQQSLVDEGANYYIRLFNENGENGDE